MQQSQYNNQILEACICDVDGLAKTTPPAPVRVPVVCLLSFSDIEGGNSATHTVTSGSGD